MKNRINVHLKKALSLCMSLVLLTAMCLSMPLVSSAEPDIKANNLDTSNLEADLTVRSATPEPRSAISTRGVDGYRGFFIFTSPYEGVTVNGGTYTVKPGEVIHVQISHSSQKEVNYDVYLFEQDPSGPFSVSGVKYKLVDSSTEESLTYQENVGAVNRDNQDKVYYLYIITRKGFEANEYSYVMVGINTLKDGYETDEKLQDAFKLTLNETGSTVVNNRYVDTYGDADWYKILVPEDKILDSFVANASEVVTEIYERKNNQLLKLDSKTVTAKSEAEYYICIYINSVMNVTGNTYTLTVTPQYKSGQVPQKVPITGITLTPKSAIMDNLSSMKMIVSVSPDTATNKNVTFSSSNPTVAVVNSSGVVNSLLDGTAIITAKTNDGSFAQTCSITVGNVSTVSVTGIELDTKFQTLSVGASAELEYTINPSDATNQSITWTSSNPSVATVDENGLVTAISAGSATITVTTVDGGFTDTCKITVKDNVNAVTRYINDNDSKIRYNGNWLDHNNDTQFYMNDQKVTNQSGASAEFTFNGTSVSIIGATSWNLGMMDVYIDGTFIEKVDLYSQNLETQKVLFTASDLLAKQHTITIVCAGDKNVSATDTYITLDAIEYDEIESDDNGGGGVIWINNTDLSIHYNGNWLEHNNDPQFYMNDQKVTNQSGASAEFTFNGTSVSIIGATSWNLGMMDVYIDGIFVETVDLYSQNLETQKVLFIESGLSAEQHMITIVCTGDRNVSATDIYITLDAIKYDEI